MRRLALQGALAGALALMLLCGVGSLRGWSSRGWDLVMHGASDVRIDRRGPVRLHISYQLPPNRTRHDLRAFLLRQGWRKAALPNFDRETVMTFVRSGWEGRMREVLVITTDRSRRTVDMQFGRCVTFGAWTKCI